MWPCLSGVDFTFATSGCALSFLCEARRRPELEPAQAWTDERVWKYSVAFINDFQLSHRRTTMKKLSSLLGALLFLSIAAFGQALTQADRDKGVKHLEETRDGVVAATKGLSEAQMKFKAAPDRWS